MVDVVPGDSFLTTGLGLGMFKQHLSSHSIRSFGAIAPINPFLMTPSYHIQQYSELRVNHFGISASLSVASLPDHGLGSECESGVITISLEDTADQSKPAGPSSGDVGRTAKLR